MGVGMLFPRFLALLLLGTALAGCDGPDRHDHPQLRTGQEQYAYHCAPCHKRDGGGRFSKGVPPVGYTEFDVQEVAALIHGHDRQDDSRMPMFPDMPHAEALRIAGYLLRSLHGRP